MPWYSAGTVAVTNNSPTVTGTGTSFSANARVGDAFRGPDGLWYEVTNVASATVVSIKPNYQGANNSAGSYAIAPMQGYVKDSADTLRSFVNQYGTTLSSLGPWSTALSAQDARNSLGLKGAAILDVGTAAGTVAAGNDARLTTIDGKTGGAVSGDASFRRSRTNSATGQSNYGGSIYSGFTQSGIVFRSYVEEVVGSAVQGVMQCTDGGTSAWWSFSMFGNATALAGSWVNGSDIKIKDDVKQVKGALRAVLAWRGSSWQYKDGGYGIGLIAQDVEPHCPGAVAVVPGRREFTDGTVVESIKSLNTSGVAAAYHTEAIRELFELLDLALTDPDAARSAIQAMKAAMLSD